MSRPPRPHRSRLALPLLAATAIVIPVLAAAAPSVATPTAPTIVPKPARNSQLYAVTVAPKSTDAWALAYNYNPASTAVGDVVLRQHNGQWSKAKVKGTPATTYINGVAAGSAKRIWAVGDTNGKTSAGGYVPMIARSSSGTFKKINLKHLTSGALMTASASSATNAWIIGYTGIFPTTKPLALRWNGKKWSKTALSRPAGPLENAFVTTSGPTNTWAILVGGTSSTVEHWNGKKWAQIEVIPDGQTLNGIATDGAHTWAVGQTVVAGSGENPPVYTPLALTWRGSKLKAARLKYVPGGSMFEAVSVVGSSAYAVGRTASDATPTEDATPIAARLTGRKGTGVKIAPVGKYTSFYALAASTKVVMAVGNYETADYCTSPFHSLAEVLGHRKWQRVSIPPKLVPAGKSGQALCA